MKNRNGMVWMMAAALLLALTVPAAAETLELLTWKGYAPAELIAKFEKETGITVKPTYSNNEEMIAKLRATRGAGFDLAQPSQDRISSVQAKYKLYQPLDYSQIKSDRTVPTSELIARRTQTLASGRTRSSPPVTSRMTPRDMPRAFATTIADSTQSRNASFT